MITTSSPSVVPFCFNDHLIRTVIVGEDPWFVAKDVCQVLELDDTRKAIINLDEDEKGRRKVPTPGGEQEMLIISESGLYTLVIRSNKPQARPFRKWVTVEVLPQIRRTGSYHMADDGADRRVEVRHTHLRGVMPQSGLDIRYTLDLTKVILHPNRRSLALLERLTGITVTDLDASAGAEGEDLDSISRFLRQECVVADPDSPEEEHGRRIAVRELYASYTNWYHNWVDDKLRYLPSKRTFTTEVCRRGGQGMLRGGVRWIYGVQLAEGREVRP